MAARESPLRAAFPPEVRVEALVPSSEEGGRVVLLVPRFGRGRLGGLLGRLLGDRPIRVKLDEFGSHAWRLFDGSRTLGEIEGSLARALGAAGGDARERLETFLRRLHREGWVRFLRPS